MAAGYRIDNARMFVRQVTLVALLMTVLSGRIVLGAATVRTDLDRSTVMVGESATLSISIENGNPQTAENFPPIKGLSIQYRGVSQNVTIVNGVTSAKRILSFGLTATEPGKYTIPAINVTVDGVSYPTRPVTLTVTKSDVQGQNRYAFLKLSVPKQEIYVGEVIPVDVQLYVTRAENVQTPQLKADGFIIHKQVDQQKTQTQIGNIIYNVLPFKLAISAAKAGKLTLGPVQSSLDLLMRQQQDPGDPFGSFFGRYQARHMDLASPVVEMNVLPLPATNAPPDFSGAIGAFSWTVAASPNTLNAGDPITLKIAITGQGNLDNLKLPEFNWPDFKAYSPNSSVASDDPLGLMGTKSFEQVIVPQSANVREIPAISLSYFDPEQKRYATLSHPAIPVKVAPSTAGSAQPTVLAPKGERDEAKERTDVVHIKLQPGPMIALGPPLVRQPWFLALQAIPLLSLVGFTLWRKRQDALANNPRLRRKIEVEKTVATGMTELRRLAAATELDSFYALLFRLLQEQLGERLDLPSSAITEAVLEERLPKRGASPELIERLRRLFQICNQARYAPIRSDQELLAVTTELETALNELRQLPD